MSRVDISRLVPDTSPASAKNAINKAYWERNMLALLFCDGWYYDTNDSEPGYRRVLSLKGGKVCFHIPDDFDIGNLRQIPNNWDGHTSERKWQRIKQYRGIE